MAELDDRLKRLVSDEPGMRRVLNLASAIMERRSAAPPPPPPKPEAEAEAPSKPEPPPAARGDVSALLASLLAREGARDGAGAEAAEPAAAGAAEGGAAEKATPAAALAEALPQLLQALSGSGGDLVKSERANLIRAMAPYLSAQRAGSLDRAMRMANVTKAAKSALHILGR